MKQLKKTNIGKPEQWLLDAATSIGLDYSELSHEVTDSFVVHCQKQHGNAETEKARGQLPIESTDIELISGIVKNPDYAVVGIKKYGQIFNAYLKGGTNGSFIYFEEVLNGKKNKSMRSKTMYKKIGKVNNEAFLNIVANHAHTDITEAKMVVGVGGHPDGEAENPPGGSQLRPTHPSP